MDTTELKKYFAQLQTQARSELYVPVEQRIECLRALKQLLQDNVNVFTEAVSKDFSWRSPKETTLLELFPTIKAIDYCIKNCRSWSKIRKRKVSWLFKPATAHLFPQPLGVVGVMTPWNYPCYLALVPAAYAIAAGNRVMIKISEDSPAFGAALAQQIDRISKRIRPSIGIINGDVETAKVFASLPFGHLLFTGSTTVGKQIMAAASSSLTPVTLELGGKSPAVVSQTVRPEYLERLFMGKFLNAGQTCIAPDYLLVPKDKVETISEQALACFRKFYPDGVADSNYTAVISDSHYDRLQNLLEDARQKGAEARPLEDVTESNRKIAPTLVYNVKPNMKIMQEEIFGPVLPVITYDLFSETLDFINEGDKPLTLYYFGENDKERMRLQYETLSGSLCINDTITYIGIDDLPFGGVGASGMGCYHGREGFDTFSKLKPVFKQRRLAPVTWMYPPYGRLLDILVRTVAGIKVRK